MPRWDAVGAEHLRHGLKHRVHGILRARGLAGDPAVESVRAEDALLPDDLRVIPATSEHGAVSPGGKTVASVVFGRAVNVLGKRLAVPDVTRLSFVILKRPGVRDVATTRDDAPLALCTDDLGLLAGLDYEHVIVGLAGDALGVLCGQ